MIAFAVWPAALTLLFSRSSRQIARYHQQQYFVLWVVEQVTTFSEEEKIIQRFVFVRRLGNVSQRREFREKKKFATKEKENHL